MSNLDIYNALKQPPKEALRTIGGGRLKGMTDISPQWRYKAMTEQFGVCGIGWKYEVVRVWSEPANDGQVFAFAEINAYVKVDDKWSEPIPGFGGSMLAVKESSGLHASDEGYKMAITDALSTSLKMLGVAADIYAGLFDGTKYRDELKIENKPSPEAPQSTTSPVKEQVSGNVPKESLVDLKWLKENLEKLKDDTAWSNANILGYLNSITEQKSTSIVGAVKLLSQTQADQFKKMVVDAVNKKG